MSNPVAWIYDIEEDIGDEIRIKIRQFTTNKSIKECPLAGNIQSLYLHPKDNPPLLTDDEILAVDIFKLFGHEPHVITRRIAEFARAIETKVRSQYE